MCNHRLTSHHTFLFTLLAREKKKKKRKTNQRHKKKKLTSSVLVQLKKIIIFLNQWRIEDVAQRTGSKWRPRLCVVNRFLSRVFGEIHRSEATPWCRPFTVSPRESLGHYYYTNYPPISDLCLFNCVN